MATSLLHTYLFLLAIKLIFHGLSIATDKKDEKLSKLKIIEEDEEHPAICNPNGGKEWFLYKGPFHDDRHFCAGADLRLREYLCKFWDSWIPFQVTPKDLGKCSSDGSCCVPSHWKFRDHPIEALPLLPAESVVRRSRL